MDESLFIKIRKYKGPKNMTRKEFMRVTHGWPMADKIAVRFADSDRDRVINGMDCYPFDRSRHGILTKTRNLIIGQGFREDPEISRDDLEQEERAKELARRDEEIRVERESELLKEPKKKVKKGFDYYGHGKKKIQGEIDKTAKEFKDYKSAERLAKEKLVDLSNVQNMEFANAEAQERSIKGAEQEYQKAKLDVQKEKGEYDEQRDVLEGLRKRSLSSRLKASGKEIVEGIGSKIRRTGGKLTGYFLETPEKRAELRAEDVSIRLEKAKQEKKAKLKTEDVSIRLEKEKQKTLRLIKKLPPKGRDRFKGKQKGIPFKGFDFASRPRFQLRDSRPVQRTDRGDLSGFLIKKRAVEGGMFYQQPARSRYVPGVSTMTRKTLGSVRIFSPMIVRGHYSLTKPMVGYNGMYVGKGKTVKRGKKKSYALRQIISVDKKMVKRKLVPYASPYAIMGINPKKK